MEGNLLESGAQRQSAPHAKIGGRVVMLMDGKLGQTSIRWDGRRARVDLTGSLYFPSSGCFLGSQRQIPRSCRGWPRLRVHTIQQSNLHGASPVVPEVEGFKRTDEVDVASEATDPVVAQPQMLELFQRFQVIRNRLDSEPASHNDTNNVDHKMCASQRRRDHRRGTSE